MVSHIFILTQDLNNLIQDALESQFKFRGKEEIFNLTATVTIKPTFKNRERLILLSLNMIHAAMKFAGKQRSGRGILNTVLLVLKVP